MTDRVLVVDGANVVGSRPDGWWRDRAGAAARLHTELTKGLTSAASGFDRVLLVLEGQARAGVPSGDDEIVRTVHAVADGDSAIVGVVRDLIAAGDEVVVVTADRELIGLVTRAGAAAIGPGRLRELLP